MIDLKKYTKPALETNEIETVNIIAISLYSVYGNDLTDDDVVSDVENYEDY